MCKSYCEAILAIVLIVFALWETTYSKWIIILVAIGLLIHSFTCKSCFACDHMEMGQAKKKSRSTRR